MLLAAVTGVFYRSPYLPAYVNFKRRQPTRSLPRITFCIIITGLGKQSKIRQPQKQIFVKLEVQSILIGQSYG